MCVHMLQDDDTVGSETMGSGAVSSTGFYSVNVNYKEVAGWGRVDVRLDAMQPVWRRCPASQGRSSILQSRCVSPPWLQDLALADMRNAPCCTQEGDSYWDACCSDSRAPDIFSEFVYGSSTKGKTSVAKDVWASAGSSKTMSQVWALRWGLGCVGVWVGVGGDGGRQPSWCAGCVRCTALFLKRIQREWAGSMGGRLACLSLLAVHAKHEFHCSWSRTSPKAQCASTHPFWLPG